LAAGLLGGFVSDARAEMKPLNPVRDTYIVPNGSLSESHGFEPLLWIKYVKENNFQWRSYVYMTFDLKSLPKKAVIEKAVLDLYAVEGEGNGCPVNVQRQNDPWNEYENYASLGYANTQKVYDTAFVSGAKWWYHWNITELVKEWLSGKYDNNGIVMFATDDCLAGFASRHHPKPEWWPRLLVYYSVPTPTPTPTLTPTPTVTPTPVKTKKMMTLYPTPTEKQELPTIEPSVVASPTAQKPTVSGLDADYEKKKLDDKAVKMFYVLGGIVLVETAILTGLLIKWLLGQRTEVD